MYVVGVIRASRVIRATGIQFVLNFNLNVQNFIPYTGPVEIVVCTMMSGVFVTERGTSSTIQPCYQSKMD